MNPDPYVVLIAELQTGATMPGLQSLKADPICFFPSSPCQLYVTDFWLALFCLRPSLPVLPPWWLLPSFGLCAGMCLYVLPSNAFSIYQKLGIVVFANTNAPGSPNSSEAITVTFPIYTEVRRRQRTVPGSYGFGWNPTPVFLRVDRY